MSENKSRKSHVGQTVYQNMKIVGVPGQCRSQRPKQATTRIFELNWIVSDMFQIDYCFRNLTGNFN